MRRNRWWSQLWCWWTQRSNKGNFYRKSLILVICITSLPTIIIGISSYAFVRTHIEQEVTRNHNVLLTKAIGRLNDELMQLELAAAQWSLDPRLDERMRGIDLVEEYNTTHNLFRFLSVMKGAYPLIGQVHLYLENNRQPLVVSDMDGILSINDERDKAKFQSLLESKKGAFWLDSFSRINAKGEGDIALIQKLPGYGQPYGALIFYIDKSMLVKLVREITSDERGVAFILGKDGHPIVSEPEKSNELDSLENAMTEDVLQRGHDRESYLFEWKGESYSVSYGSFSRLGAEWKYVAATPLSQITAPVILMSRIMLGIGLFGLVAAILLSWMASQRLYRPIGRLMGLITDYKTDHQHNYRDEIQFIEHQWQHLTRESRELQSRLEHAYPSLRAAFIMQLVQGHFYSLSEEEIRKRMKGFGWNAQSDGFVLLLLQISGVSKQEGRFLEKEEPLITFAAANIATELAWSYNGHVEVINFQDLTVGMLLSFPQEKLVQEVKAELFTLADEFVRTISSLLKLQTAVCIGKPMPLIKDIPLMLQYLRNAIRYRNLEESYQVLDLEELLPYGDQAIHYPFELERELIQAFRMGQEEQCMRLVERVIRELAGHAGNEKLLQESVLQVLGSILHAVLESGFQPHALYGDANLYKQLHDLREPEQMVRFLQGNVIAPYIQELNKLQNIHMKQLVQKVTDLLNEHYAGDISLEQCADVIGTYPYTLSKAFRQIHGMNFIDYLTMLRIAKAKELLSQSDMKVNDIAEYLGYRPPSFIRLFRKHERMTPGQYREQAFGE